MGDVAGPVLGFPGETFAHRLDGDEIGELFQHRALARVPRALDELDDARLEAVADAAEHHAEGGCGFALAFAGVNNQQAAFNGLAGHDLVAGGLLLRHLLVVAGKVVVVAVRSCSVSSLMSATLSGGHRWNSGAAAIARAQWLLPDALQFP